MVVNAARLGGSRHYEQPLNNMRLKLLIYWTDEKLESESRNVELLGESWRNDRLFFRRCPRSLLVISFNIEVVASLIVEVIDYGGGNHIDVYVWMEVMILRPMNISIPHGMMIRCAH